VSTVETRLKGLQRELESAAGGRFAKDILLTRFGPLEDQLGKDLVQCLDSELEPISKGQDEVSMELAVFIGRVAASLSTASPFVEDKLGSGKSIKGVNLWYAFLLFSNLGRISSQRQSSPFPYTIHLAIVHPVSALRFHEDRVSLRIE